MSGERTVCEKRQTLDGPIGSMGGPQCLEQISAGNVEYQNSWATRAKSVALGIRHARTWQPLSLGVEG